MMYKLLFPFISIVVIFSACGTMFDVSGKGSKDKKIYYDIATCEIINTYTAPINSMYIWKRKKEPGATYVAERIVYDEPLNKIKMNLIKDSIAFYDFQLSLHLQDDHWRMMHHLDITQELLGKKQKIYSRFTSH